MLYFNSYAVGNKIFNIQILLIISQSLKFIGLPGVSKLSYCVIFENERVFFVYNK